MTARLAMLMILILTAASCGSSPGSLPAPDADSGNGRSTGGTDDFEGWQEWQQILSDPGLAGTDYDPLSITVNYRPDASFELAGNFSPPPGYRAADLPNGILRKDRRYEAVTDHISGRFGIPIDQQVYARGVLMASFSLPAAGNGAAVIESIRSDYGLQVLDVTYSRLMRPCFSPNDNYYLKSDADSGGQWGLHRIGVPQAWQRSTGDPELLIGVVDSGCLLSHEDIGEAVLDPALLFPQASCDLLDGDRDITDTDGHGTAVCSIIAAETDNLRGLAAVLPAGRVLPLRIGTGSLSTQAHVVAGCMLAAELESDIINLSWAATSGSRQLSQMVESIAEREILLMAAAGNDGDTLAHWPAAYSAACGVASSGPDDSLAEDASHGVWCDISAPGVGFSVPDILRDNLYQDDVSGSSLACALACGAAGLLMAIDGELNPGELRQVLVDNGLQLNGGGPPRLDLASVLHEIDFPTISLAAPSQLQQEEFLQLEPQVTGQLSRLELWIDDAFVMSRSTAPWQMTADLRSLGGGVHELELRAIALDGQDHASAGFAFLRAADELAMPWQQGFEHGLQDIATLGLGGHAASLQADLAMLAGFSMQEQYSEDSESAWQIDNTTAWNGTASLAFSPAGDDQHAALTALLTAPVSLVGYPQPTLSLAARWQMEEMEAGLLISADGGQSWQFPQEQSGFSGRFSGQQDAWRQLRYDLTPWQDQAVQLLLLSQAAADATSVGEGLWIDALSIATEFQSSLPVIESVELDNDVLGAVPARPFIRASLLGARNVQSARYWLDCEPLGSEGPEDVVSVAIIGAELPVSLALPPAQNGNRHAVLRVDYQDEEGAAGPRFNLPVWIFDRRGDANADGTVSEADLAMFGGRIGLTDADELYDPFLDSDLDGLITELDAASVAYNLD